MSNKEKEILKSLTKIIDKCTEKQKAYFLGFAEGVEMITTNSSGK